MPEIRTIPHAGWKHVLQLRNASAELLVTLDVGPRVISYKTPNGPNIFAQYADQLGTFGEEQWKIRGGHRLWLAPEGPLSNVPDNGPVTHREIDGTLLFENPAQECFPIRKVLSLSLEEEGSTVTVHHEAVNEGSEPVELATWGISVMAPGGLELIPRPEMVPHAEAFLPRDVIVPWPYTNLADRRWCLGRRWITLRQVPGANCTKLGLSHRGKWVAYYRGKSLFIKSFDYIEGEVYPDFGCNFETYTDGEMLEIESLSPLRRLEPGESIGHTERWTLLENVPFATTSGEDALVDWITPLLPEHARA